MSTCQCYCGLLFSASSDVASNDRLLALTTIEMSSHQEHYLCDIGLDMFPFPLNPSTVFLPKTHSDYSKLNGVSNCDQKELSDLYELSMSI